MMRETNARPATTVEEPLSQPAQSGGGAMPAASAEPLLCQHCGRTASNGLSCIGACVADSGY